MFAFSKYLRPALQTFGLFALMAPLLSEATGQLCIPLAGKVRLDPDPTCQIISLNPGPLYLGQLGIPNTCYSVQLTSAIFLAKGSAGLTSEALVSPVGGAAQTPGILNESGVPSIQNEFGLPETRRIITGRSVLSLPGGKVFTSDAGVIHGEESTEQLIVTGGTGLYANAKGTFYTSGKVIQQWGSYNGQLCYSK